MSAHNKTEKYPYGMMAEFETPEELLEATRRVRSEGYTVMDAFSPSPIEGLADEIGFHRTGVTQICLLGGIIGGISGYCLQWYCDAISYPVNVAGRPFNDLPAFIPVTYECTILFAGLSAAIGMLFLNGFPQPYHPVFNVERFQKHASSDRFFIVIERRDPKYNPSATRKFLESLKASGVYEVEE
jgi:hypothetical protein